MAMVLLVLQLRASILHGADRIALTTLLVNMLFSDRMIADLQVG